MTRELIMDALNRCEPYVIPECCVGCPYDGCWGTKEECITQLHADAMNMLKAQEPRVMTLEEVVGNIVLKRDVILWFEFNGSIKELNANDIEYNDYLCDDDIPTLYEPNLKWRDKGYLDGVIIFEYNDVFRCWTSRPDEKVRIETPWGP